MEIKPTKLTGRVARLEPLEIRHAEGLAEAATPELFTYHFPPPEFSPEGFRAMIQYLLSRGTHCPFAIVARESEQVLGMTSYLPVRRPTTGRRAKTRRSLPPRCLPSEHAATFLSLRPTAAPCRLRCRWPAFCHRARMPRP